MFGVCRDSVFRVTPKCARRYKKYDEVCFTFSLASINFHVFMGVLLIFFSRQHCTCSNTFEKEEVQGWKDYRRKWENKKVLVVLKKGCKQLAAIGSRSYGELPEETP